MMMNDDDGEAPQICNFLILENVGTSQKYFEILFVRVSQLITFSVSAVASG